MGLFSLHKEEKQDNICPALYSKHLQKSFSKVKDLDKDIIIPEKGGIVWLQTEQSFNAFDILVFLSTKFVIKRLLASTYSISRESIESIINLHDSGRIEQIELLISDSMIKRNPGTIENLMAMASTRANVVVKFAWIHAKVNLIETHEDAFYVLEGSGNWSRNAHFEQYVFAQDKEVFNFRKEMFNQVKAKQKL